MGQYLSNLKSWWWGFSHLRDISYKPGWNHSKFFWLYLFDYGACVIFMAGPVTSISRYTQDHWFSSYHGAHTGPDLWGTRRCDPWVRVVVPIFWALLLAGGLYVGR